MKTGRRWELDEHATLIDTVARGTVVKGKTMAEAFEMASKLLDRNPQTVQAKFYNTFSAAGYTKAQRREALDRVANGKITAGDLLMALEQAEQEPMEIIEAESSSRVPWSAEEEMFLLDMVLHALDNGQPRTDAFKKVADMYPSRSPMACASKYGYMIRGLSETDMSEPEYIQTLLEEYKRKTRASTVQQEQRITSVARDETDVMEQTTRTTAFSLANGHQASDVEKAPAVVTDGHLLDLLHLVERSFRLLQRLERDMESLTLRQERHSRLIEGVLDTLESPRPFGIYQPSEAASASLPT